MTERIGLYGGTFDPIHFGHINLALELMEKCHLSAVWFIPATISPLKNAPPLSGEHRLNMLSLALRDIPFFTLFDDEITRGGASYTVDTVRKILKNESKEKTFFLLLGEDVLWEFSLWKEWETLIELVPLLIGCRHKGSLNDRIQNISLPPELKKAILTGLQESAIMEISATRIRERLKNRLYCGHLVPAKVLDYIYENQLYFSSKYEE